MTASIVSQARRVYRAEELKRGFMKNSQPLSSSIDVNAIRRTLAEIQSAFVPQRRSKTDSLLAFRSEILALRKKRASTAIIAQFLTQAGFPVSDDTVRRFLLRHAPAPRSKFSGHAVKTGLVSNPKPAEVVPRGFKKINDHEL